VRHLSILALCSIFLFPFSLFAGSPSLDECAKLRAAVTAAEKEVTKQAIAGDDMVKLQAAQKAQDDAQQAHLPCAASEHPRRMLGGQ